MSSLLQRSYGTVTRNPVVTASSPGTTAAKLRPARPHRRLNVVKRLSAGPAVSPGVFPPCLPSFPLGSWCMDEVAPPTAMAAVEPPREDFGVALSELRVS